MVPVDSLEIALDAHTHLLPGVDDGEFTPDSAVATLARMYEKGIRRVCLTPHVMAGVYENTRRRLTERLDEVVRCAGGGAIPELHLGAEYMVDQSLLSLVRRGTGELLAITRGRVLIEMSWWAESTQLSDVVAELVRAGLTPVLAHPERYSYMAEGLDRFDRLHEAGCEFQLNLHSATGACAEPSARIMNYLLERALYRHVGSDVHSPRQFEDLFASQMDRRTAIAGERAGLWILKDQT